MSGGRRTHGFLRDEQGDWSLARLSLTVVLGFTLIVMALDVASGVVVADIVYDSLVAVILALATWAGAPRTVRYLRDRRQSPSSDIPEAS